MPIRYHKKSTLLLAKTQSVEGTPVTPAGTDALALFDGGFQPEISSETFQFTGSEEDRSEGVTITDRYASATGDFFLPALGTVATGQPATVANFPYAKLFEACGFTVTYGAGTGVNATVTVSNASNAGKLLTLDFLEESPADPSNQNLYRLYDCRGILDLDIQAGSRARLKAAFKGNTYDALSAHINDYPLVQNPKITPNYGTQKEVLLPAIRQAQVTVMELQEVGTSFTNTSNFGFAKMSVPNLSGRENGRVLDLESEGFDTAAVASDITLTMTSPKADATFVPEKMLEKFYKLQFAFGTTVGRRCKITLDQLQCMNVANDTVGNYKGKAITFRNTGSVQMVFS